MISYEKTIVKIQNVPLPKSTWDFMNFRLTLNYDEFLVQISNKNENYYVIKNWWLFLSQHRTLFMLKNNLLISG